MSARTAIRTQIVRSALARLMAAEDALDAAIKKAFPKGAAVRYRKGRGRTVQSGIVLDFDDGQQVKVRNRYTGREYWVSALDLLDEAPT